MTVASGVLLPVGTRFVNIWALNSAGRPLATSASIAYTGLNMAGGKQLQLTVPEPRKITHSGDDRPEAVDFLPALEASTAELHVSKTDYSVIALLSSTKVFTIGESKGVYYATNKQGFEPFVGLMVYQQALDAGGVAGINGARRWRSIWAPKCKLILMPHGTDDNAADLVYKVSPSIVNAELWGVALTDTDNGATEMQFTERMFEGIPFLDSWLADGVLGCFQLSHTALSTAKVAVFKNGVKISAGITVTTVDVDFAVCPTINDDIQILYEY